MNTYSDQWKDQLRNVPVKDVEVGQIINLDPIIGREVVEEKTTHTTTVNGAEVVIVRLVLKAQHPTLGEYQRTVFRGEWDVAIHFSLLDEATA